MDMRDEDEQSKWYKSWREESLVKNGTEDGGGVVAVLQDTPEASMTEYMARDLRLGTYDT